MKKLFSVLFVLLVACALFAQGSSEEKMNLVIYSAGTEAEAEAIVEGFNEKHPNVECTIIQLSSGDVQTRVNTEWPQPEGDVIFLMGSENLDALLDNKTR